MDIDFTRIPEGQYQLAIFRGSTGPVKQTLYQVISEYDCKFSIKNFVGKFLFILQIFFR